jgi:imidazolonepropionase-like amidohydrolase
MRRQLAIPLLLVLAASAPVAAQVAVQGDTVYTVAGAPIRDGVILIRDGRIERVGPASEVRIPAGYAVHRAKVVTPGLVDAHGTVGVAGALNVRASEGGSRAHDQEQIETSSPLQPELRAVDAYNPRERLVAWVRSLGTTTVHTGHAPGAVVSGQTVIVKLRGGSVEEALLDRSRPAEMLAVTLGPSVMANYKSPGTRPKSVAVFRQALLDAKEYGAKRGQEDPAKRPARDLRLEALVDLLEGRLRALVTAQTAMDIHAAIRLGEEFGYPWVLDGGAEAYLVLDALRQAGIPVILHPTLGRAWGEMENASFRTAARLREAGLLLAVQSGYEPYVPKARSVLFEAGVLTARGLTDEQALAAVTLDAARILGVDGRVGSLEPGKDADLVLFDGEPFEYTTRVCKVLIEGVVASDTCR